MELGEPRGAGSMTTLLDLPQTSARVPDAGETPGIGIVKLGRGAPLRLTATSDNVVCVVDGFLNVAFDDSDFVLMPGDQLTIRAGERHRAWNPSAETTSVVVGEVQAMTGYRHRLGRVARRRR
jgi:mannose-6-phosphate isomerase-like protein (cupin superfamily)